MVDRGQTAACGLSPQPLLNLWVYQCPRTSSTPSDLGGETIRPVGRNEGAR
jgi:hypothetical protein